MLDLKRLRVLAEVARRGSFSAAADALYLSQSAVSQQVATLEREVGLSLLERTNGGPKLTDAGRTLVDHGEAAIARLEEPEQSLPMLHAAEIDLALTFDYTMLPAKDDRDVDRELLLTESMYVALPRDHPLAGADRVRLADLADEAWVCGTRPSSCSQAVVETCRAAGFEPRIAFESDEYPVLQGYVAAGLGYTLLPDLALPTLRADLVVRPTKPDAPQRRVWGATRPEGARSPATEAMVATLGRAGERVAAGDLKLAA